jgi:hypothetical protein
MSSDVPKSGCLAISRTVAAIAAIEPSADIGCGGSVFSLRILIFYLHRNICSSVDRITILNVHFFNQDTIY